MSISQNLQKIRSFLDPYKTGLIAVSKTYPSETILEAYNSGQTDFGENKVQELVSKYEVLPKNIRWHLIGHLQSNKIKYIAPFIHLIHSVDSFKLLKEIDKEAKKNDRIINCLLQIHIAQEETKFGFSEEELFITIQSEELKTLKNIRISGLMGMASNTDNESQIKKEFQHIQKLFNQIKSSFQSDQIKMEELSIGMSSDYKLACESGSTMVRVGNAIFGSRNYL
ncbi:MAG: YggS family pyridoxal phosphate-dependent enzyme [Sporocytophaga sp.]|nr:YggS family pyridoxal phosphate-dependent enzyme [Sporocytophaga sp.]